MTNPSLNELVSAAVGRQFDRWAVEHPSLASVIDRVELSAQAAESLRSTPEYRQAVADFHRDQSELMLLNRLVDLAGPILQRILSL